MAVIWTIGHGDRTFADIERALVGNGIAILVDVRSIPHSRHAEEFTKASLTELCGDASIYYRWMGASLGGRPVDPELLLASGAPDLEAISASPAFRGGIEELTALARTAATAIMCSESDPAQCHRTTLIAPALEERGFEVVHLLADGTAVRHQSALPL
jgi:uncharacterized protein (DUF488 family)